MDTNRKHAVLANYLKKTPDSLLLKLPRILLPRTQTWKNYSVKLLPSAHGCWQILGALAEIKPPNNQTTMETEQIGIPIFLLAGRTEK